MKGIYGIKVDNCLVYIGQAVDINERVRSHLSEILGTPRENKYWLLRSVLGRNKITFWLLEEVAGNLDEIEKQWIKAVQPCLNSIYANGNGHRLTCNEFYQIICNEEHEIPGASEWHYIKKEKKDD